MILAVALLAAPVITRLINESYSFVTNKYDQLYGVETEIERLLSNLSAIQAVLQDAEKVLSESNSEQLQNWFMKLGEVALDVQDVLEKYASKADSTDGKMHKLLPPFARRFGSRREAAAHIKAVLRRMDIISDEKAKFHFKVSDYVSSDLRPQTFVAINSCSEISSRRSSGVVGREKEKHEIVTWLTSSDESTLPFPVLPIVGMGGIGKTTLVQLVYNDEKIYKKNDQRCHFKVAMWVDVSSVNSDVDGIFKQMLAILTEMSHDMITSIDMLQSRILKVLDGKRFLLVLDNVWPDKLAWKPIVDLLAECPQGSKVLVTSRDYDFPKTLGELSPMKLTPLPENETWELFAKRVFVDRHRLTEEKEEIGKEIIQKCNFLPLAVKAMAGLLCTQTEVNVWKNVLKDGIWESDQSEILGDTPKILPALKLSYDRLSSQLKQCFAYCSIFPKAYMFDKNELVKMWIAQGYINPRGADKVEDVASYYFQRLITLSFFQLLDENNKTYRMHDLFHDLAKFVSSSCCQQLVEGNKPLSIAPNARHVSFFEKDAKLPAEKIVKAKKLRTLLLRATFAKDSSRILNTIFQSLSYLRVLDLNTSTIQKLPKSIGELKLLSYLDLSATEITVLPDTICNLRNLQTLRLLQCLWLSGLPKNLGNMKNLRYLELDDMFWYKCSKLPPRIGTLTNLHNFNSFHVRRKSGYGIKELEGMKDLKGSLHISNLENSEDAKSAALKEKEYINKLILEWTDEAADLDKRNAQDRVLEDLEPHENLQELHINYFKGNRFPSWMGVLCNLTKISLKHCINCRILPFGTLRHLGDLRIKGLLELVQWPADRMYHSLTRLSISNCPKVTELPNIFINLRVAKIKQCNALTVLPVMPCLMFLRLIDNPLLENWHESTVEITTRNDQGDNVFTRRGSFTELLELKIINCPILEALPRYFFPQKLEISGCTSLRSLPCENHSQRLQCLEIDNCSASLIEAIPTTSTLYSLVISNISDITSLPELPQLPGLKALYIDNLQNLVSLFQPSGSLQSIETLNLLSISGCGKLVIFPNTDLPISIECLCVKDCSMLQSFHPRNCLKSLTSLKDLYLEDCPALEFFPEDGLPTSLRHLYIRRCPLLTQKCSNGVGGQDHRRMISHITDLEIDFIKTPESQGSTRPKKRCFVF